MRYESKEIESEVNARLKQFNDGLITLGELIRLLTILNDENTILILKRIQK